jgi:hypothetical protein
MPISPTPVAKPPVDNEPPGVPGFRTWKGVYAFVFGAFILMVIFLAIITRVYA